MALTVGPLHAELAQLDVEQQVYTRKAGNPIAMLGRGSGGGAESRQAGSVRTSNTKAL